MAEVKKRPRRKLPNLCRICLTGSSSMINLCENFNSDDLNQISNLEALEDVMGCMVTLSKHTPNHICSMCLSLLRISYNLKEQFKESQKKLFGKLEENGKKSRKCDFELAEVDSEINKAKSISSEVDIVVGKENYSLSDILIVEDEEQDTHDYTNFFKNLGKTISVEYSKNKDNYEKISKVPSRTLSDEKNKSSYEINNSNSTKILSSSPANYETTRSQDDDGEEYETIVIETIPDNESVDNTYHWEHEYAKNANENFVPGNSKKKGGRKSKYPTSIMDEINSLIIEGNTEDDQMTSCENTSNYVDIIESEEVITQEPRRRKRGSQAELQEIEKYIIYGSGEPNSLDIKNQSMPGIDTKNNDNVIQLDVINLESNGNEISSVEIDDAILADELVREAFNTKNICQQCSMSFATRISLKRHLHSVHGRKDVFLRKPKSENLSREARIKRRIEKFKQNLRKNPMVCELCGYVSKSSGGARYHLLTHGERMYKCEECPKKFYTPSHLKNHFQYKHEAKTSKHLCPLCGEYRNSSTALSYHIKLHTEEEKKFPCPICGIKFIVKSALKNHIRRHNGDRRYPCEICFKSFFSSNELKKHFMIHTGEKPFQCNYCDKRFVTPFNQKVHMMTHEGPFICAYCRHKGFIDMEMLKMHLKHKHRISASEIADTSQDPDQESHSTETQLLEGLNLLPPEEDNLDFEGD